MKISIFSKRIPALILLILLTCFSHLNAQIAFPGAEGHGKNTVGGRGGVIIKVSNASEFTNALNQVGPRIIVFTRGGIYEGTFRVDNPYCTIAGQTAPGDGVLIKGKLDITTSEVIVRSLGIECTGGDGLAIRTPTSASLSNVIIDHVSVRFGGDENMGVNCRNGGCDDITVQNSMFSEGLLDHSKGLVLVRHLDHTAGPNKVTVIKNLFTHNTERNPQSANQIEAEIINNVSYDWGNKCTFIDGPVNVMGNYYKPGPSDNTNRNPLTIGNSGTVYPEDNYVVGRGLVQSGSTSSTPVAERSTGDPMTGQEAYDYVIANVGPLNRTAHDLRNISELQNGTGAIISDVSQVGGYTSSVSAGTAWPDSDGNGIHDDWGNDVEGWLNSYFDEVTTPGNTAPTITSISNQTIDENGSTGNLNLTVGDAETAAGSLSLTGSSSNTSLVTTSGISFGGSGASRTVNVTPVAGAFGTATITITVSDGTADTSTSFTLTVNQVTNNTAPTITSISDQTIDEDQSTGTLSFTVGDAETSAGSLTLSGTSSNTSLVNTSGIAFGGSGANRTVNVTPIAGASGNATITITVSDGTAQSSTSFSLTVNQITFNTAPTITRVSDQTIDQDQTTGSLSFTVGDAESSPGALTLTGNSNNNALVATSGISFGGSGANRTVNVTPIAGAFGTATITLTVSDGAAQSSTSFTLTVNELVPGNTAPTITNISDQVINQDQSTNDINFTIGDADTPGSSLVVTARSNNGQLVSGLTGFTFGGSGYNRTVRVTPIAGAYGIATITLTVTDGIAQRSTSFLLTVNQVVSGNQAPTITGISDQTIQQDASTGALNFTIGDAESAANSLTMTGTSNNSALVASNGISFTGSGANRTVSVTPAAGESGACTITLTVSDGANQTSTSFVLTVDESSAEDFTFSVTIQDADCENQNGNIDLVVNGGTAPYSYSWSTGATTASIGQLASGTYTVTVTDQNSVVRTASFVVNRTPGPAKPEILNTDNLLSVTEADSYQWYLDGEVIAGATSQEHQATSSGNYSVQIVVQGCSVTSDDLVVNVVDTFSQNDIASLSIYPNPVRSDLNVDLTLNTTSQRVGIAVFSVYGRPIIKKYVRLNSANQLSERLNLSRLRPGTYLIKIKVNREVVTRRFIKF